MKLLGVVGLLLISLGVLSTNKKRQDILFIAGGILLTFYSLYIDDLIFVILQAVFIFAALYDLFKISKHKK